MSTATLDFDNIASGRLLVRLMKLCGMWTYKGKSWNIYYRICGWTLHLIFTFLFIFAMYVNIGLAQNLDQLSEALYMSLTETALLVKVLTIMITSRRVADFFELFESCEEGTPKDDAERELVLQCHANFRRLRNSHIGGSLCVLTLGCLSALLDHSYRLPFPCWIPFDYRNEENYIYAYIYVSIGIAWTATSNYTLDLFYSYLLFQSAVYYKLLGKRFENLGSGSGGGNFDDNEIRGHFEFHSFVSRTAFSCESLISLPIFLQIVLSAFVICFTVYKLQNMSFLEDPSAFLMFVMFAFVMALQIYLPCNYGDDLTSSSDSLTTAIYSSRWFDLPQRTRKDIFVYMESLKRPIRLRAGNFFIISLSIFAQVMNNAYRLYALLINVNSK